MAAGWRGLLELLIGLARGAIPATIPGRVTLTDSLAHRVTLTDSLAARVTISDSLGA